MQQSSNTPSTLIENVQMIPDISQTNDTSYVSLKINRLFFIRCNLVVNFIEKKIGYVGKFFVNNNDRTRECSSTGCCKSNQRKTRKNFGVFLS